MQKRGLLRPYGSHVSVSEGRILDIVAEEALVRFQRPVVIWTGGKYSMLALWYIRKVSERRELPPPPVLFIDRECTRRDVEVAR